ncbi:uncharacterized protein C8A04DRAFT_39243 [Dichotomopilus funicola]|uniref:BTB domain-containing protein n=1 Tax=Dichotomopilus funicola TaxID=1934379 RepID=A0AAN6ZKS0_9PEZI|nr:hypothetical protein C8A04DRAFT_39243 [Dichotomopilus funicola]
MPRSGNYSDLTITCQGKSYRVHKAIVCPRSGFFTAACSGEFKANDDSEAVDAMINYIYCLNYDLNRADPSRVGEDRAAGTAAFQEAPPDQTPASTRPDLLAHAKVFTLAEKYLISGLKALALQKFVASVSGGFDVDDFLDAVQQVYRSTLEEDGGLREIIVSTLYNHKYLLDQKEVQAVLKDIGAVTYDLVMFMHKQIGK